MDENDIPHHPVPLAEDQTFEGLGLGKAVLASVVRAGFEKPTPIQAAVIPPALTGRDIIGLAQTGSGKTAAFVLPIVERLTHGRGLRGLILSPTREIALQTKAFLDLFGTHHDLLSVCLIGGVKMNPQIADVKRGPDIIVATPGRLMDHVKRGYVKLAAIEELVLDEADHMLDLGFLPQVQEIIRHLPKKLHTMMFSATMPPAIEQLTKNMLHDPLRIDITPKGRAAENISHRVYVVYPEDKRPCLMALLHQELGTTLVFARRKVDAEWLYHILEREGHPVTRIHSDRSQGKRVEALETFREGEHRILVATDIAGRGIDVPGISHIINFDVPENVEDYIHRAGRTARIGMDGIVSSIASWQDLRMIREIEDALGEKIPRCTVPGVRTWEEPSARAVKSKVRRRV